MPAADLAPAQFLQCVGHALAGSPDGYVDLVSLDITAGFVTVQLNSPTPPDNATGVSPGVVLGVTLQDYRSRFTR